MNIKYEQEANLLEHYNRNIQYSSPIVGRLDTILNWCGIEDANHILDVGCGDGYALRHTMDYFGCSGVGIDYASKRIVKASACSNARFIVRDINYALPDIADGTFDLIMLFEVLEHLVSPETVLKECRRILKSWGKIIGSVPLNSHYIAHLQVFTSLVDVAERLNVRCVGVIGGQFVIFKTGKE